MFQHQQSRRNVRARVWRLCSVNVELLPVYQHCTLVLEMGFNAIIFIISDRISFVSTNTNTKHLRGSQRYVQHHWILLEIFLLYSNSSQLQRGHNQLRQSPNGALPDRHSRRESRSFSICERKIYAKRRGDVREWHQQHWTMRQHQQSVGNVHRRFRGLLEVDLELLSIYEYCTYTNTNTGLKTILENYFNGNMLL